MALGPELIASYKDLTIILNVHINIIEIKNVTTISTGVKALNIFIFNKYSPR